MHMTHYFLENIMLDVINISFFVNFFHLFLRSINFLINEKYVSVLFHYVGSIIKITVYVSDLNLFCNCGFNMQIYYSDSLEFFLKIYRHLKGELFV